MADETRDVIARLKIEKTGEPGAFKEAAGDIEQLGESAESASKPLADVGQAAEQTSSALKGEAAAAGEANAANTALGAGAAETSAALQGQAAAAAEAKAATTAAGGAASEAAPAMGGLATEAEAAGTASAGAGKGMAAIGAEIGPVVALVTSAIVALKALETGLNELKIGGRGDEFKLFSNPISASVDAIRSLVSYVGNLGDALDVFESKQGSTTEKLEAAKQVLLGLTPAAKEYRDSIEAAVAAANKEAETLVALVHELEQSGDAHGAVSKKISEDVDGLVDKFKSLGVEPPKVLTELVARYGEVEEAAKKSGKAVTDSAQQAAAAAKAQAEETRALAKEQAEQQRRAEELAAATAKLVEQQTHLQTATVDVGGQTVKVSDILKDHTANMEAAAKADAEAADGLGDVVDQGRRAGEVFSDAAEAVGDFADGLARVPEEAQQAESAFDRITKGAQAANDALLHKGPRGGDAGSQPDDFAPVVQGENTQLDAQATRFDALREKVDALNQSELTLQVTTDGLIAKFSGMDSAAALVDAVSAAIDKVLEKAEAIASLTGIEGSVVASMRAIVAEAAIAAAAIQQVHDAAQGGGGQGEGPPPPDGGDSGGGGGGGF